MIDQNAAREWMARALAKSGLSQAELARELTRTLKRSIDKAAINKMLPGPGRRRNIKSDEMYAIGRATKVSVPSDGPEPAMLVGVGTTVEQPTSPDLDLVEVPEFELHGGASYAGGFPQEDLAIDNNRQSAERIRAKWGVPVPFLRSLNVRASQVHLLAVRGDSMEHTLFDGDRVLIDTQDHDVSQGGIFALRDDLGSIIIKQVEPVRGANPPRILCSSRNERYRSFELSLADPQVAIIGRVACRITRL